MISPPAIAPFNTKAVTNVLVDAVAEFVAFVLPGLTEESEV